MNIPFVFIIRLSNSHLLINLKLCVINAAASQSGSLMEVFKAAFSEGSNSCDRIAIKADGKSYSYGQITSSALRISKLLCKDDTTNVWSLV